MSFFGPRFFRSILLLALPVYLSTAGLFAAKPGKAELREQKKEAGADAPGGKSGKRDDGTGGGESRQMTRLREQMEVTDDAEWALIADRIKTVDDLRRSLATSPNGRIALPSGDKAKPNNRPAASAQPEQEALRSAVGDRLPDAEIKARLQRAHEAYLRNESKLERARAELRAVLTIRQEAVAVMAGLLTP
ncbi:MAG: hypothetical protein NTV51_20790 [Verrucomicrobia bacterium]|nr:hypothetical protein [Verrucomicrobiota bacterium]